MTSPEEITGTIKIAIQKIKTDPQLTLSIDLVIPTADGQRFTFMKGLIGM